MSAVKFPLEKTIEQLLMRHECVVLPGFGGFIVRDSPCNFNNAKDQLKPFARHIFFNPHLLQNDGLLNNEIAKQTGLSFSEAGEACKSAIEELKLTIESNGSKSFGNLGTFFKGQENIWFAPSSGLNLALESYGLRTVDIHTVLAESKLEKEQLFVPETVSESSIADRKPIESIDIRRPGLKPWIIAASIALLVHFVYLKLEKNDFSQQQAAIITLDSAPLTDTVPVQISETDTVQQSEMTETLPDTGTIIPQIIVTPVETPASEKTDEIVPEESASIKTESGNVESVQHEMRSARYKMESNAIYHMKDLIKQGKSARVEFIENWYWVIITDTIVQ